jgi:ubiquinone/menaquinone biosynthesis C-methylase UbiE
VAGDGGASGDREAAAALFAGTAEYYARHRPGYPEALVDALVAAYGLDERARVADLGCGTGQLTRPLAARVAEVTAIDPSPEMLRVAAATTPPALAARIRWVAGVGEELAALVDGPLALVTAAGSFQWMDRDRVLAVCDRVIAPGGGVAIVLNGPSHIDGASPAPWAATIQEVVRAFLGPERRAGSGVYRAPGERHEVVLARSPFGVIERWQQAVRVERSVDEIIGLQLSTSYSSPVLLGAALPAFVAELRARLLAACPDGRFVEESMVEALMARRPAR